MLRITVSLLTVVLLCAGCSETETADAPGAGGEPVQADTNGPSQPRSDLPLPPVPTTAEADAESSDQGKPEEPDATEDSAKEPELEARESTRGKWVFYISQRGNDFPVMLLEVSETDTGESLELKLIESSDVLPQPAVKESRVDEDSATIEFSLQDATFDFEGSLADSLVRGNVVFDSGVMSIAWLHPTEAGSLDEFEPKQAKGNDDFEAVFAAEDSLTAFREFASKHNDSPLALLAYQQLLQSAKDDGLDVETVEKVAQEYFQTARQWGGRVESQALLNAGFALSRTNYLPELAVRYLNEVESRLDENSPAHWKPDIELEQVMLALRAGSEEEKKQAAAKLGDLQSENVFDHRITLALADYAEEQNNLDEAMRQYARLAVLPSVEQTVAREWLSEGTEKPLPSESLTQLWEKQHGSTQGLDEYLKHVYEETIYSFADEGVEPQPADGASQIALIEMFTGAQCPPCVAADVAVGGIEATYSSADLIALRYHEHIPGPDPLTNQATESRFDYYRGQGTPTIIINGSQFPGGGGYLQHAEDVYRQLRQAVDSALGQQISLSLDLSAHAEQGELTISANVAGLEDPDEDLRLRLVLAEEEIHYIAPNGIRVHEMVVRDMPGGAEGVAPSDGKLNFSQTINLATLKQQLIDYLANYEEGRGLDFPVKPLEMTNLRLVAFVQNDESKDVLQAASVQVSGEITYPENLQPASGPEFEPPGAETEGKAEESVDEAEPGEAAAGGESEFPDELVISVRSDGEIRLHEETKSLEQLASTLVAAKKGGADPRIVIRAERDSSAKHVMDVLAVCRRAKISDVSLATAADGAGSR